MKISIAIPNFNGKDLLDKNLPAVLAAGADEVMVIDDGSSDESITLIKEKFSTIRLLVNSSNRGFIYSVNRMFAKASGEVVVLLNSDVSVSKNFLKPLIRHFQNQKVFAVNCHEEGEGYSEAFWKDGFFEYQQGEEAGIHRSSWASGGSAAYRKKIWQELGGFDSIFHPFYWEDVDLSFRAIKAGYEIFWEPDSLVWHQHETTIKKAFKERYVRWVQQRNQLLFIWKNISDKNLLSDHKKNLIKRLFREVWYWVPYFWALSKWPMIKKDQQAVLSDQEAIDYVNN